MFSGISQNIRQYLLKVGAVPVVKYEFTVIIRLYPVLMEFQMTDF